MTSSGGNVIDNVRKLRELSQSFRTQYRINRPKAERDSAEAIPLLARIFQYFRNEQDYGRIPRENGPAHLAWIARDISEQVARRMITNKAVDRRNTHAEHGSFREALNTIAHQDEPKGTYRIDNGRHILVLTGWDDEQAMRHWVAEIDVDHLCDYCEHLLN